MSLGVRRAGGPVVVTLALAIILLPFGAGFPLTDDPSPRLRAIPWLDLALLALVIAVAARAIRTRGAWRSSGAGTRLWATLLVLLAASFAVQPSLIGAQTLLRLTGVLAIAIALTWLDDEERPLIIGVVATVTLFELGVAVLQLSAGGPIGLVGEAPGPLLVRGDVLLPRGTLAHGYILAGLSGLSAFLIAEHALVARRPGPWIALSGMAAIPVGLSCSRAALAGWAAGCAALARAGVPDRRHRWVLAALLLGVGVPALIQSDGWLVRAEEGLDLHSRTRLIAQAITLISEHPLLGVGAGRYVAAARERFPDAPWTQAVHDVPLIIAAEGGVVAGVVLVALLVVLAWRALRSGPAAVALYLAFVPFVIVDVYPYTAAQGTVVLGLWIGGLDRAAVRASPQWRTSSARPLADERRTASASSSVRSASSPLTTGARRP